MEDLHISPYMIASAHPETIMTTLLKDAIDATHLALGVAYPEIGDPDFDICATDQTGRLAFVLLLTLAELDRLIDTYHLALRNQIRATQIAQLDLPF